MNILYQSKLKILGYAARKLWILTLPILRILLINKFHPEPVFAYFKGLAFDILILMLILVYGFYKWKTKKFIITPNSIICRTGFFRPREIEVDFEEFSSMHTETDWLIRRYDAIRVVIKVNPVEAVASPTDFVNNFVKKQDTPRQKDKEIELLMRLSDFEKIHFASFRNKFQPQIKSQNEPQPQKISAFRIIFFAELFSNIPHGIIMVGMAAWWFFDVIDDYINVFLKFGIVFILFICKIFSFLRNLERLYGAYISEENGYVIIKSGFFKKYSIIINTNKATNNKYLLLYILNKEKVKGKNYVKKIKKETSKHELRLSDIPRNSGR